MSSTFQEESSKNFKGTSAFARTVTAADFFAANGYDEPKNFIDWGSSLTPRDESELRKFIRFMKDGYRLDGGSDIYRDKAGKQYQYYRAFKPRSQPGAKVVISTSMVRLIDDYENGRINVDFNLEDLIEQARKLVNEGTV